MSVRRVSSSIGAGRSRATLCARPRIRRRRDASHRRLRCVTAAGHRVEAVVVIAASASARSSLLGRFSSDNRSTLPIFPTKSYSDDGANALVRCCIGARRDYSAEPCPRHSRSTRRPAVAGMFYPADDGQCRAVAQQFVRPQSERGGGRRSGSARSCRTPAGSAAARSPAKRSARSPRQPLETSTSSSSSAPCTRRCRSSRGAGVARAWQVPGGTSRRARGVSGKARGRCVGACSASMTASTSASTPSRSSCR